MIGGQISRYMMRPRSFSGAVFICALVLGHWCAPALAGPEILPEAVHGAVVRVIDATTLRIDGLDGVVRLAALQVAKGDDGWTELARAKLVSLTENHVVSVRTIATDRDNRIVAHMTRDDGLWLQAEMIRAGVARLTVNADTASFAQDLLAVEEDARRHKRGLWSDRDFAVRDATDVAALYRDAGTFQLVQGQVVEAVRRGDMIYLNFGDDYHHAFAVQIPRSSWALFNGTVYKLTKLAGRRIRAHGWITRAHAPAMEVTVPDMLEVLP